MQKHPIIIGIDPGTTLGIAIIGIDGKLLNNFSQRAYSLSEAINHVTSHGYPICIGTDKSKVPKLIRNISTNLGIKIYAPKEDMTSEEKKILIQKYETKYKKAIKYNNAHEYDSICCALYAYVRAKKLLSKIKLKSSLIKEDNKIEFYKKAFSEDIPIHRMIEYANREAEELERTKLNDKANINGETKLKDNKETQVTKKNPESDTDKEFIIINKRLEERIVQQENIIKSYENKIKMLRNRIKILERKDRKKLKKENALAHTDHVKNENAKENEKTLREMVHNNFDIIKIKDKYYINNQLNDYEMSELNQIYTSKGKKITLLTKIPKNEPDKGQNDNKTIVDVEQLLEQHKLLRRIAKENEEKSANK
jgi:uncharacterized protein